MFTKKQTSNRNSQNMRNYTQLCKDQEAFFNLNRLFVFKKCYIFKVVMKNVSIPESKNELL